MREKHPILSANNLEVNQLSQVLDSLTAEEQEYDLFHEEYDEEQNIILPRVPAPGEIEEVIYHEEFNNLEIPQSAQLLLTPTKINNIDTEALVDCGATSSFISLRFVKHYNIPYEQKSGKLNSGAVSIGRVGST